MSLNSNMMTNLQLDYPFNKYLKNNRNFNDFSLKSAHFYKYHIIAIWFSNLNSVILILVFSPIVY